MYPWLPRQRRWAHHSTEGRNVAAKLRSSPVGLRRRDQEEGLGQAKKIYQAGTRREAVAPMQSGWAKGCRGVAPKAVMCLKEDLEELLPFLECLQAYWPRCNRGTTNAIERAFREVRRRTRPMICPDGIGASMDRIIFGVINYLNQPWKVKPLKEFTR